VNILVLLLLYNIIRDAKKARGVLFERNIIIPLFARLQGSGLRVYRKIEYNVNVVGGCEIGAAERRGPAGVYNNIILYYYYYYYVRVLLLRYIIIIIII